MDESTSYANIQVDMSALICTNVLPVDDLVLNLSRGNPPHHKNHDGPLRDLHRCLVRLLRVDCWMRGFAFESLFRGSPQLNLRLCESFHSVTFSWPLGKLTRGWQSIETRSCCSRNSMVARLWRFRVSIVCGLGGVAQMERS